MARKMEVVIKAVDEYSRKMKAAKKLVLGTAAIIGAAATGGAMIAFVRSVAMAEDALQKWQQRLGVSTDVLSQYEHVARLSGVTNQQLFIGWQRMTRRISEASKGAGEAVDALKELGLEAEHLVTLSPDKQFEAVAEKLQDVESQSDKVRLAFKMWDSEGVALLQTLNEGTDGLKVMREEAEKFGLVVTPEAARNSELFMNSLTRVGGAFRGVKNAIAEDAMPELTGMFNALAEWVAEHRPEIVSFFRTIIGWLLRFAETGIVYVARFIDGWQGLKLMWNDLKIAWLRFNRDINDGLFKLLDITRTVLTKLNRKGIFDGLIQQTEEVAVVVGREAVAINNVIRDIKEKSEDILNKESAEKQARDFVAALRQGLQAGAGPETAGLGGGEPEEDPEQKKILTTMQLLDQLAGKYTATAAIITGQEAIIAAAAQGRARITNAANKAMENQLLSLIEMHKFSVGAIGKALAQQVKIELVAVAAKAAVQALYFTALGLAASTPWGAATLGPPGLFFAAAGKMAAIAGASLAGAAVVHAAVGGQAERGEPGSLTGEPIQVQQAAGTQQQTGETLNVTIVVENPLVDENWDNVMETQIVPALKRAKARDVQMEFVT